MTETEELLTDLQAVYSEMHPSRPPEAMQYTDTMLAMGVLMRREIRMQVVPRLPYKVTIRGTAGDILKTLADPRYRSNVIEPSPPKRFSLRGKILDGLAKHNPRDPE